MKLSQFLFMAEAEGCDDLVDTREARLNAIRNDILSTPYTISTGHFIEICTSHGIDPEDLTQEDFDYIQGLD